MSAPRTCRVTVWRTVVITCRHIRPEPCGEPVVDKGLCARHLADRVRLLAGARGGGAV